MYYSSSDPIKTINNNISNISINSVIQEENQIDVQSFINDYDSLANTNTYNFSNFTNEIIIYIAGFVVYKLASVLNCETCLKSMYAEDKNDFLNSLITIKNKGGNCNCLSYPSQSVISIYFQTENVLKSYSYQNKTINKLTYPNSSSETLFT